MTIPGLMLALLLAVPGPVYGPPAPVAIKPRPQNVPCPPPSARASDEVVVCGRRDNEAERLPLREDRFADGEVVRHPGEPAGASTGVGRSCARPGSCEPSRLMDTLVKAIGAVTGNGP